MNLDYSQICWCMLPVSPALSADIKHFEKATFLSLWFSKKGEPFLSHPILNFLFPWFGLPLCFYLRTCLFSPHWSWWPVTFFSQCPPLSYNQYELSHVLRTFSSPHSKSWLYSHFQPHGRLFLHTLSLQKQLGRAWRGKLTLLDLEKIVSRGEPSLPGLRIYSLLWVLGTNQEHLWILWLLP